MHNTPSLGPVETDTSEAYAPRSQTEWAISLMGLHTVLHTYTAVACSAVSGGCSLFPWMLINSVISAYPVGQNLRGPIQPNETQKHFTPSDCSSLSLGLCSCWGTTFMAARFLKS